MRFLLSLLLSSSAVVMGSQDSSIWLSGTGNANTENPQYYREATDVVDDLPKFDSLYIKFDSCVYSEAGSDGRDDRNYDDFSALEVVGNGKNWWYVGHTPFIQANVAFSLYGVLSGDKDKGCTAATFINSFHTLDGINSFLATLEGTGTDLDNINFPAVDGYGDDGDNGGDDGAYVKDCVANYVGDYSFLYYNYGYGDDDGDGNQNVDFGDDAPTEMLEAYYRDLMSYGLGCNGEQFEFASFSGGSCDPRRVNSTMDRMSEINELFEEQSCLQIYGDSNDEEGDGDDNGDGPLLVLLSNSQPCENDLQSCPDPHQKLSGYAKKLEKSLHVPESWATHPVNIIGNIFMVITIMLLVNVSYLYCKFCGLKQKSPDSKVPTQSVEGDGLVIRKSEASDNADDDVVRTVSQSKFVRGISQSGFVRSVSRTIAKVTRPIRRDYSLEELEDDDC